MEQRLTDVEIKVAFLENHISELDGVLQQTIARLERAELRIRQLIAEREAAASVGTLEEEVPPHYGSR